MDFMQLYLKCMKERYADFNVRAGRQESWMFMLVNIAIYIVLAIISGVIGISWLPMIYALAVMVPGWAVGTRRLHDIGKSGWFQLVRLIPLVGLWLIVLWATEGQQGDNQYGADPKAGI